MSFLTDLDEITLNEMPPQAEEWNTYISKQNAAHYKADRLAARQKKQAIRISRCGKWSAGEFDPQTGRAKRYAYQCDAWREGCVKCLARRAEFIKNQFVNIAAKKTLYAITVEPAAAKKLIRKMQKNQYEKFPSEDGDYLVFEEGALNTSKLKGVSPLTIQDIYNLNWAAIVKSPAGRNKSGSLSVQKPATNEKSEFNMVATLQVVTDAPQEVQANLMEETVAETQHMQPTTIAQVEKALARRSRIYGKKLRNSGNNVFYHARKRKINKANIDWKCHNSCITKPITENTTYSTLPDRFIQ